MTVSSFLSLLPDPGPLVSGGHIYNTEVLGALQRAGCEVGVASLDQPLPENTSSWMLFDTLDLGPALDALPLEERRSALIVHHLESFYPPRGDDGARIFREVEVPRLRRFQALWATSRFTLEWLEVAPELRGRVLVVEPATPDPAPREARNSDP